MKIIGIVAEYNPFHNGHMYQLQKSVQDLGADGVIAVMSGNFVQRGFPAFLDKWTRTELAISSGANLVIELPTFYATASAEQFAYGSVSILEQLKIVDYLCFGSESMELELMLEIASILASESVEYTENLSKALSIGVSFPAAREMAIKNILSLENMPTKSNSILAIEYLKALKKLNSIIKPYPIKRIGKDYNDEAIDSEFSSASGIRKAYFDSPNSFSFRPYVPKSVADIIESKQPSPMSIYDFEQILLYKVRSLSAEELFSFREVNEGLEHKLKTIANKCRSYDELVGSLKSKRYTMTKLSRMLINILLGIKKDFNAKDHLNYARILGFDSKGQEILRHVKRNSEISLISNLNHISNDLKENPLLKLDCLASDIYSLGYSKGDLRAGGSDLIKKPIIR